MFPFSRTESAEIQVEVHSHFQTGFDAMRGVAEKEQALAELMKAVKSRLNSAPGCHDWEHTRRVLRNARVIMARMQLTYNHPKFNSLIVKCAAVLHDAARPEELASNGAVCHAALGAELAPKLLKECGFDDAEFAAEVADCVKTHRYRGSSSDAPLTLEQKIIFDADKLDSIGAIGVARALHFSGRIGSSIHNSEKDALGSEAYGKEDSAYREYLVKLRHIPSRMLTEPGREMAIERGAFTAEFFERLNSECE
jgi:uncharacterized protein